MADTGTTPSTDTGASVDTDGEAPSRDTIIQRVGYQRAGQVRRALSERTNAIALGMTERIKATDKELAALGWTEDDEKPEVRRDAPPVDRSATPVDRTVKASTPPAPVTPSSTSASTPAPPVTAPTPPAKVTTSGSSKT